MTAAYTYTLVALVIVVLVALLTRHGREEEGAADIEARQDHFLPLWDGPGLNLAERIFDSADYLWLREELHDPHLARILVRSRQRMALRWLKAFRWSFDELVRNPEAPGNEVLSTWKLNWLVLRFHFLLGYAVFIVRFLGPYHRLVPSLDWLPSPFRPGAREALYRAAGKTG